MHVLGEAAGFEAAHDFYLDAGRDEGFVIPLHRLHRRRIGRHTGFCVFGSFAENHDFHNRSPGWDSWDRFCLKDVARTRLPTILSARGLTIVLDTGCTTRRISI